MKSASLLQGRYPAHRDADSSSLWLERGLLGAIVVVLAFRLFLVFRLNVNWDEFFYLSHIYSYVRGELATPWQSFYVHLFRWLTVLPFNEIGQVIAGRLVMLALALASTILLYRIANLHFTRLASLACVLVYVTFSNVLSHGASFRADPLCGFLFLGAVFLYLDRNRRVWPLLMTGAFMALAFMISIKSSLYVLFWAVLLGWRLLDDPGRALREIFVLAVSFAVVLGLLFSLHLFLLELNAQINAIEGWKQKDALDTMARGGSKTLFSAGFLPRGPSLFQSISQNAVSWFLIVAGGFLALFRLIRSQASAGDILALSGMAMLITLLFYRNAFPYFYVFLMPAVVLASGPVLDWFFRSMRGEGSSVRLARVAVCCSLLLLAGNLGIYVAKNAGNQQLAQGEIIDLVHRLFPEPVAYIDRNSMVSSFPKVGFFMSSWGIESYRERGVPIMRDILEQDQPKFLIANRRLLWLGHDQEDVEGELRNYLLIDDDFDVLKDHFVHHWGALYVAGKKFRPDETGGSSFEVLIAGPYTLESQGTVNLDGQAVMPGEVVHLEAGEHLLDAAPGSGEVVLRYGDNLHRPARRPADQPIYVGL